MELDHDLKTKIDTTVDSLVNILKRDLLSPSSPKRGMWDRFKNWMSNVVYGRYGRTNPYYFVNRLGDMGGVPLPEKNKPASDEIPIPKKENYSPIFKKRLTIEEYRILGKEFEIFENKLSNILEVSMPKGAENLQIIRMLDDLAQNLKKAISKIVSDHMAIMATKGVTAPVEKTTEEPENTKDSETTEEPEPVVRNDIKRDYGVRINKALEDLEDAFKNKGMPEEIYNSIKKNLIEIGDNSLRNGWQPDVEDKLTDLENKISGVSTMKVEPTFYRDKDEIKDVTEEEFPFDVPDTKEGLEKIRIKIRTNKEYKNAFKNWGRIESKEDIEIFNKLNEKVDKILSGGEDIPLDIQEKIIKKYKVFVNHVIKSQEKNDETIKFESRISPLYSLSLKEKTIYIKELISERQR
jgi:hypothetical protein